MVYKPNINLLLDGAQYGRISAIHKAYIVGTDMNSCDTSGLTALHLAAIYQTDAVAQTLLNLGASHSVTTKVKQTPLYYAARYDNPDVLHTLLDAGADINTQDEIGNTPLHVAVYMGNTATVQELLLRGASKLLENRDGHTPEDFATSRGFADITPFVALTAEEKTRRVKWVVPTAPAAAPAPAPDPKKRHKGPQWRKPAPDQPPTNPDPLTKAECEFLESLPIYFINLPQAPTECVESVPPE